MHHRNGMADEIQRGSSPAPHSLITHRRKRALPACLLHPLPSVNSMDSCRNIRPWAFDSCVYFFVATATQRSPLSKGRRHSKPRNGDLEFSEEPTMTALLYRGHSYEAQAASPKACVELTYRREHYNTCREEVAHNAHPSLTYRGASYTK